MTLTLDIVGSQKAQMGTAAHKEFVGAGGSIGRAADNDWVVPDPYISGHHARIHFRDGRYFLEDISTNGVYLKGCGTRLRKGQMHALESGEQLCLDQLEVRISVSKPAAELPTLIKPASDPRYAPTQVLGYASQNDLADDKTAFLPPALAEFRTPRQPLSASGNAAKQIRHSEEAKPGKSAKSKPASEPVFKAAAPKPVFYDPPDHVFNPAARAPIAAARLAPTSPPITPSEASQCPPTTGPLHKSATAPQPAQAAVLEAKGKPATISNAATTKSDARFDVNAMLAEAGIPLDAASPELARALGKILRTAVEGMIEVLREREQVKEAFRLQLTMFQQRENNPLKFSANVDDAMHNLFVKNNPAYLGPDAAFVQGFQDLHHHHLALLAALHKGSESVLRNFDPERLQARFDDRGTPRKKPSFLARGRYWEQFRAHYRQLTSASGRFNQPPFADDFAHAYNDELKVLRATAKL